MQQRRRFQSAVVSARGEHPRRLEAVNVIRSDLIELDEALVVETTNYRDMGEMRGSDLHTEALRIVERFTVVDPETIAYEARIDDRKTFTGEWTVAFPFQHDPAYQIFEYACHEANYSVPHMLSGARGDGSPCCMAWAASG